MLETSKPTTLMAIELLIAAGILAEVGNLNRYRRYRDENYLKILE